MKAVPLAVAGAFHTPIMQSAVERLSAALQHVEICRPRIPVISNVDAQPHDDPAEIRDILVQQVVRPVQWEASMRRLLDEGYRSFYEVGPGKVLRGLLKRIDRKASCESGGDSGDGSGAGAAQHGMPSAKLLRSYAQQAPKARHALRRCACASSP